ncbi:hypothetical protein BT96DRAFT_975354 [Gymnopus androsaceus JB14]|uniref:Reverse transcriptase domain-containing protein n=1 Tax=Gymnopus androsaceus JB14 TaxID=1447944 RepID=A0A6A4HUA1_9AGAR|nr:hypothetical protein BT96DRAFT_975354 [Gymnopus androsaceus JB14]
MSNGGSAFGQTFQHITAIKLHELEKQRETCVKYVEDTLLQAQAAENPVSHLEVLLSRITGWSGTGLTSLTSQDICLNDYKAWHHQALHDPSISSSQVLQWISTLEVQLKQAVTRYDYAKLFGDLLKEWLQSGDSLAVVDDASSDEVPTDSSSAPRSERIEQRDRIQSLIFEPKHVDIPAIETYLASLFSSTPEATAALDILRSRLQNFGDTLLREQIDEDQMPSLIRSLLSRDLLSAEKATILKGFLSNEIVLKEVASVLGMQLARLDTWEWPEEGVFVEMRRHLSGKYSTSLPIHRHEMEYRTQEAFKEVMHSKAWKSEIPALTRDQLIRRRQFRVDDPGSPYAEDLNTYVVNGRTGGMSGRGRGYRGRGRGGGRGGVLIGEDRAATLTIAPLPGSIQAQRKTLQSEQFFMTQLPDTIEGTAEYDEEPKEGAAVKPNPGSSDHRSRMNRSLPSCVFLVMPDKWVKWFEKWLAARLTFDNSPDVRIRARGVPIAHALSVICGEAILFGMDFAVNQRAQGLYVYRIYDDFWFLSHSGQLCADAWQEMKTYASLVGITFNAKKTGGACVGGELEPSLPRGAVAWGFLVFDAEKGRFAVDQKAVDVHIQELKRQLEKTKSVFGYVNVLNKYMGFFRRNFGQPAHCFGQVHVDEMVETFERIQRAIFEEHSGSVVEKLRSMVEAQVWNQRYTSRMVFLPGRRRWLGSLQSYRPTAYRTRLLGIFSRSSIPCLYESLDKDKYEEAKTNWMNGVGEEPESKKTGSFMSFDEYILGREDRLAYWGSEWKKMQEVSATDSFYTWDEVVTQWVSKLYAEEIKAYFGGLQIVEPTLIPVGMLSAFRTAKIAWDS